MPIVPTFFLLVPSIILLGVGFLLSTKLGFPQLHPIKLLRDVKKGGKRSRRYFWLSLGGIMGAGNITGVAAAIKFGGQGAVFWMVLGALVCAPVKYAEIYTAITHKAKYKTPHGGAMYYLSSLSKGKFLPILFCVLCVFSSLTTGDMVQSGAVAEVAKNMGIPVYLPAVILCAVFAAVTYLVPDGAARFSALAVPIMTVLYLSMCTGILVYNFSSLPTALVNIIRDAFGLKSFAAGGLASLILSARYGLCAGLLSHEAGMGTSPMAHCENGLANPDISGKLGILEVYADTVLGALMTALCIVVTGSSTAFDAFDFLYGFGGLAVSVCLCLFALSSAVTWHFYGVFCTEFVMGRKGIQVYTIIFIAVMFISFFVSASSIYSLADISNCTLSAVNTTAVAILFGKQKGRENTS